MSGGGGEEDEETLEFTPTWVVAAVCFFIIAISFAVERSIHYAGKMLKKKHQRPLFEALQKVKEELMLLGFISLMLTVLQGILSKMCIPKRFVTSMLPCSLNDGTQGVASEHVVGRGFRRLLSESAFSQTAYCAAKNKVPFLSIEALHHLHIFIFVLAVVHVCSSLLTVLFGGARIRQWKEWETAIVQQLNDTDPSLHHAVVTPLREHAFIKDHFAGIGLHSSVLALMHSFLKQFYGAVTKADYLALRLGFIMTHCKSNPKFNFHKYMMRALEDDFKRVVGISWYLWIFVIIFLLVNVNGWHIYFWMAFIPFILLLAVGTKLEHIISELAHEVVEKHVQIEGDLVVKPSDQHFWFNRPQFALILIHFILFQNAFEIGFFFWIWLQYGFHSCILGKVKYIIPRLVVGVFVQVLCSYSTLPLYAIVTQMGTNFKKAIFDEHVQAGILGWRAKVKKKHTLKESITRHGSGFGSGSGSGSTSTGGSTVRIQLAGITEKAKSEIQPVNDQGAKSNG